VVPAVAPRACDPTSASVLLTYFIAQCSYRKVLLRQVVGSLCDSSLYERLRTAVITRKDYEEVVRRLNEATSAHRVARSASFNFLAIGVIVLTLTQDSGGSACGAGALVLGLSFWMVAIDFHRYHMFKLRVAADSFEEGKKILAEAGEKEISFSGKIEGWWILIRAREGKGKPTFEANKEAPNTGPQADS